MVEIWQAITLAAAAGFVNYLQKYAGDSPPPWKWFACVVKVFTGGFVGYLTFLLSKKHLEPDYVLVAVAIAAYGGPLTLDAGWAAGKALVDALLGAWIASRTSKSDPKG